jgi:hypothetical protein
MVGGALGVCGARGVGHQVRGADSAALGGRVQDAASGFGGVRVANQSISRGMARSRSLR